MKHLVITICCAFVLALAGGIATGSHQAAYAGNPNCVSPAYGCASSLTVTAPAESDAPGCAWSFGYYKIKFTAVACATNYLPDTMTATRAHVGGAFEHVTLTRIGSTATTLATPTASSGPTVAMTTTGRPGC